MATIVQKEITLAVQRAVFYCILADESKDVSKQEQMSIVVRFSRYYKKNSYCF